MHRLCEIVAEEIGKPASVYTALIRFVTDRPGHVQRYAIDRSKLKRDLGWSRAHGFDQGLRHTVRWYLEHHGWLVSVRLGEYRKLIEANYTATGRA